MPRHEDVSLPARQWVELSSGEVAGQIAFQNRHARTLLVKPTADASAPSDEDGVVVYETGQGDRGYLADMFPGMPGATRLWGWSAFGGKVFVSHA